MQLFEKTIQVPKPTEQTNLIEFLASTITEFLGPDESPVRFAVTKHDHESLTCELGVLKHSRDYGRVVDGRLFDFRQRAGDSSDQFNAVLLVPTGIDAEIGGDAGDAAPVARLLATACDTLITHPNVVNASDINELPESALYVEGSVISRLMMGTVGLVKPRSNRVLVLLDRCHDAFIHEAAINSVSAARASLGMECPKVVLLESPASMHALYSDSGRAVGTVHNLERVCDVIADELDYFDAFAISSVIRVPDRIHRDYFLEDMINPWGGVEAMLTHAISFMFDRPSAHSPMVESRDILNLDVGVVDPRKAAEAVSTTYLHCILKGLHRSPRIVAAPDLDGRSSTLTVSDVSCLVIPDGCVGIPTLAALYQGVPVVAVRENRNIMQNDLSDLPFREGQLHIVDNYLEAVGVMNALRAGVAPAAVRRPFCATTVVSAKNNTKTERVPRGHQRQRESARSRKRAS